jgi:hypothetical protein
MRYRLVNIEINETTNTYKLLGRDYDSAIYRVVQIPSSFDRFLYRFNLIDLSPIVCYNYVSTWYLVDGEEIKDKSLISFLNAKKWLLHNYNKETALKEDDT